MPLECLRSVEARPIGVFDDASSGRTVFRIFFGPRCADGFEEPVSENNVYVLSPNYRIHPSYSPFSSLKRAAWKFCGAEAFIGAWEGCSKQVWRVEACLFNPCRAAGMIQKQFTVSRCTEPKNRKSADITTTVFCNFSFEKRTSWETTKMIERVVNLCAWGWTRQGYAGDFIPGHLPPGRLSIVWMMQVVDPMAHVSLGRIFFWKQIDLRFSMFKPTRWGQWPGRPSKWPLWSFVKILGWKWCFSQNCEAEFLVDSREFMSSLIGGTGKLGRTVLKKADLIHNMFQDLIMHNRKKNAEKVQFGLRPKIEYATILFGLLPKCICSHRHFTGEASLEGDDATSSSSAQSWSGEAKSCEAGRSEQHGMSEFRLDS